MTDSAKTRVPLVLVRMLLVRYDNFPPINVVASNLSRLSMP